MCLTISGTGMSTCCWWWPILLAPVVQTLDSAIHWINHYPLDNSIGFASVYPLDGDLSSDQHYPSFEQLGPGVHASTQCTPFYLLFGCEVLSCSVTPWLTLQRFEPVTSRYRCDTLTNWAMKSWLFQASIRDCLNCVHNCDDHSLLDFKSAVQYMKHFIYHFTFTTLCPFTSSTSQGSKLFASLMSIFSSCHLPCPFLILACLWTLRHHW